ncbi:MAG TPA: 4-(cytidine 5'-diphospho)-2-C-methyl-D-erythritol kinase [Steroidobacteraceae bacterium]|nr:4-(cytidine 5'-diphospho)-2-C-methyl-D-erythritol kinase [Steroidobacteraceae bacterium]
MTVGDKSLGRPQPWPAPGKLNLCLHVVGRRPDGYHDLQTAFQFIDLCDEIRFFQRPPGLIERLGKVAGVPEADDLAVRAARLLARSVATMPGVAIEVRKRLPLQGGVGGGSSDAATVLVALNALWDLRRSEEELAILGLQLGADVPVFVRGRAAWAEGVGERLTPVDFPEAIYLLVQPDVAVPTAEVFKAPELTRDSPVITIRGFLTTGGRNDFEPVVRRRFPAVAEALEWLERFAPARLTGTGACVFAPMPDEQSARAALGQLPGRWRGWVVRGCNRSPLAARRLLEQPPVEDGGR